MKVTSWLFKNIYLFPLFIYFFPACQKSLHFNPAGNGFFSTVDFFPDSHVKEMSLWHFYQMNMAFQSVVFNSGHKMALRAFYFIITLTKYYCMNRTQRHLLAPIANNWLEGPTKQVMWLQCYCFERIKEKINTSVNSRLHEKWNWIRFTMQTALLGDP